MAAALACGEENVQEADLLGLFEAAEIVRANRVDASLLKMEQAASP